MERVFISSLIRDVEYGKVTHDEPNESSVRNAIVMVNRSYGGRLSYTFGLCSWYHLKERHASTAKEKPFTRAYYWDSEPAWIELKIIFGYLLHEYADAIDDELYAATPLTLDETIVLLSNDEVESSSIDNDSNFA
ncbi:hypothetical protein Salat_2140900 [Sesamum alatum]|uniref:Uncharacterized protein n=1 Tax=Sesamum alatum TaxID=300844 RepID=A0AAE1Y263_9LAMI|nr:hypothetical protein Salat_2140900 [Sesamum alatum]